MSSKATIVTVALLTGTALAGCATTHHESNDQAVADSTISANVKAALVQDPVTRASNIAVNTLDGKVQLSGFVNSRTESDEAEQDARHVAGVRSVKNALQINSAGPAVAAANDDATITNRVEAALAARPDTDPSQVKVTTSGGVVQLAGFVNSDSQRDAAGAVARSVQGVRSVVNDLQVKSAD